MKAKSPLYKEIPFILLLLICIIQVVLLSYYGLSRHYNYLSSLNDLGHFDQAIWGILNGYPFLTTDMNNAPISRLGGHFDPIIALFVPFYAISPSVIWLIFAQALAIPLAALPIYLLAKKVFLSPVISLIWAVIYLLNPFVLSAASWDFHPVSLAVPFVSLAYLGIERRSFKILLLCCLVLIFCKEHYGVMVIFFGFLWLIKNRDVVKAVAFMLLGSSTFVFLIEFLMPMLSGRDNHGMMTTGDSSGNRYGWLGYNLNEITQTLFAKPYFVITKVFTEYGGLVYLLSLLGPFLLLPLIGVEYLLPGGADLLANLLSKTQMPKSIFSYHTLTLVPPLVVSSVYGVQRISASSQQAQRIILSLIVLTLNVVMSINYFPYFKVEGFHNATLWNPHQVHYEKEDALIRVQSHLPKESSLSVQANIGAHFTQRKEIYRFPNKINSVDYVVLLLRSPTTRILNSDPSVIGSLGHHLQMAPQKFLDEVAMLLQNENYGVALCLNDWVVFERGYTGEIHHSDVRKKIELLRKAWHD